MATRRDLLKAGAFGGAGLYLASKFGFIQRTHCHILDHEDHDMMRPIAVGKPQIPNP